MESSKVFFLSSSNKRAYGSQRWSLEEVPVVAFLVWNLGKDQAINDFGSRLHHPGRLGTMET